MVTQRLRPGPRLIVRVCNRPCSRRKCFFHAPNLTENYRRSDRRTMTESRREEREAAPSSTSSNWSRADRRAPSSLRERVPPVISSAPSQRAWLIGRHKELALWKSNVKDTMRNSGLSNEEVQEGSGNALVHSWKSLHSVNFMLQPILRTGQTTLSLHPRWIRTLKPKVSIHSCSQSMVPSLLSLMCKIRLIGF